MDINIPVTKVKPDTIRAKKKEPKINRKKFYILDCTKNPSVIITGPMTAKKASDMKKKFFPYKEIKDLSGGRNSMTSIASHLVESGQSCLHEGIKFGTIVTEKELKKSVKDRAKAAVTSESMAKKAKRADKKLHKILNKSLVKVKKSASKSAKAVFKAQKLQGEKQPTAPTAVLYNQHKEVTKTFARSLRVGDVIEAYYLDTESPQLEVVVQACGSKEDIWDLRIISLETWTARKPGAFIHSMNTDKCQLVGHMQFVMHGSFSEGAD